MRKLFLLLLIITIPVTLGAWRQKPAELKCTNIPFAYDVSQAPNGVAGWFIRTQGQDVNVGIDWWGPDANETVTMKFGSFPPGITVLDNPIRFSGKPTMAGTFYVQAQLFAPNATLPSNETTFIFKVNSKDDYGFIPACGR